jgi:hypothetical protein
LGRGGGSCRCTAGWQPSWTAYRSLPPPPPPPPPPHRCPAVGETVWHRRRLRQLDCLVDRPMGRRPVRGWGRGGEKGGRVDPARAQADQTRICSAESAGPAAGSAGPSPPAGGPGGPARCERRLRAGPGRAGVIALALCALSKLVFQVRMIRVTASEPWWTRIQRSSPRARVPSAPAGPEASPGPRARMKPRQCRGFWPGPMTSSCHSESSRGPPPAGGRSRWWPPCARV